MVLLGRGTSAPGRRLLPAGLAAVFAVVLGRGGLRRVAASVGLAALVASIVVTTAAPGGADLTCTPNEPVLRDHTINQGVGSYARLARGKETLVRLYLSMSSCTPSSTEMQLTGASISVTSGAVTLANLPAPVPPLTGTNTFPTIAPSSVAPMLDNPADPIFVVPGSALTLPTVPGPFDIAVSANITYQYRTSSNGTWVAGQKPFSATTGSPMTHVVNGQSGALRILGVPMGNSIDGITKEFPANAYSAVQSGMVALARMLPVADGVGDLTSSTGGVRYRVLPTLLDLGPNGLNLMLPNGQDYCGRGEHFEAIQAELAKFLQAWNSENPATPADRVVGLAWEGVSIASATNSSCIEGWAKFFNKEAWARVTSDSANSPGLTGGLLTMELMHTFGAVAPGTRAAGVHSKWKEADVTAPNRAYNLATRSLLTDDRSALRFTPPGWNNISTALEPEDWHVAMCALTPPELVGALPGCVAPGTAGGAPAGGVAFVLAGSTDGTVDGTDLASYKSPDVERSDPDDSSLYKLRQLDGNNNDLNVTVGVPVRFEDSHHAGVGDENLTSSGAGAVDVALDAHPAAKRFEFWKGIPQAPGSVLLYARNDDGDPQVVGEPTSVPAPGATINFTSNPGTDERPALSADGTWLAWVGPDGTLRARTVDGQINSIDNPAGTDPAWFPSGTRLAFVRAGDVYVVEFNRGTGAFGTPEVVYDNELQPIPGTAEASHPTISSDGSRAAIEITGDIYVFNVEFALNNSLICSGLNVPGADPCAPVANEPGVAESAPSWFGTATSGIHYQRAELLGGSTVRKVGNAGFVIPDAELPSAGSLGVVFKRGANVWLLDGPTAQEVQLTFDGADTWPAIPRFGGVVAFDRLIGGQHDVMLLDTGRRTLTVTVSDDHPADLRLDVFIEGSMNPVVVDVPPAVVGGGQATFHVPFSVPPGFGGEVHGRATDGWHLTYFSWGVPPDPGPSQPVPAIYSPAPGTTLLQFDDLPLRGDARNGSALVPDGDLHWTFVRLLAGGAEEIVATADGRLVDVAPPVAGWTPGQYEVRLRVGEGADLAVRSVTITVLEDGDRDGIPKDKDKDCTTGVDLDGNPTNAFGDPDGDGIPSQHDALPCVSAKNATVNFDPDLLYVPAPGQKVTLYVTSSAVSMKNVDPATVEIVQVGNFDVHIPAVSWSVDKKGVATAKFNQADLDPVLINKGLVGQQYVRIVVTGTTGSQQFRGFDLNHPQTAPAGG